MVFHAKDVMPLVLKCHRPVSKSMLWDGAKFIAAVGAILAVLLIGASNLTYNWQWYRVPRYIFSLKNEEDMGTFVCQE